MLISPADVGRFAAAALTQSARFRGHEIDLGAEALTQPEIVGALARVSGREVRAERMPPDEVDRLVRQNHVVAAQTYFNELSAARIDAEALRKTWGIELTGFDAFLDAHRDQVQDSFGV
jgi:uncharacterized protein YbjT (DUF2867 family)